jgi:hypothetical protein
MPRSRGRSRPTILRPGSATRKKGRAGSGARRRRHLRHALMRSREWRWQRRNLSSLRGIAIRYCADRTRFLRWVGRRRAVRAADVRARGDIFIYLYFSTNTTGGADRPTGGKTAGCWPGAQGSQPVDPDRPPGVSEAGRRGRGWPPIPRRGNDARKRACGIWSQVSDAPRTEGSRESRCPKTNAVLSSEDSHPALCTAGGQRRKPRRLPPAPLFFS